MAQPFDQLGRLLVGARVGAQRAGRITAGPAAGGTVMLASDGPSPPEIMTDYPVILKFEYPADVNGSRPAAPDNLRLTIPARQF